MRLSDYFDGIPVELRSPKSFDSAIAAINDAARSPFSLFATDVVGRVRGNRIRLRCRLSIFSYNYGPLLAGKIERSPSGSLLLMKFRAPIPAYFFFPSWYFFLCGVTLGFLASPMKADPNFPIDHGIFVGVILSLFFALPIAMHYVFTRRSDEELGELIGFLRRTIDARPS
jgi:hypothetical protein